MVDTCCPRRDQCLPNCGDPPPDPNACDVPGASPFCPGGISNRCGELALTCHCGRHSPEGFATDGSGMCVDSTQFSDCNALIWCGGQGDALCEAVLPGSQCVFDDCCQWRCALTCGEAPPSNTCDEPWVCGTLPVPCGDNANCSCMVGSDGTGICLDMSELSCVGVPCRDDRDCPPTTRCDAGESCCGSQVCVPTCPSAATSAIP